MEIEGSVGLATGASRGIGLAFARALLARCRNDPEVLVDQAARRVRSLLSGPLDLMYPAPSA